MFYSISDYLVFFTIFCTAARHWDVVVVKLCLMPDHIHNSVERHLCTKTEEYRWDFVAYAVTNHPFSDPLVVRRASYAMKKALSVVKARYAEGKYLKYKLIQNLFF